MKQLKPFEAAVTGRRAALGISQEELAEMVGVHAVTLRKKLREPGSMSIRELNMVMDALKESGISRENLFKKALLEGR